MAKKLYVRCKKCGRDFPSPIQADETSFGTMILENNSYQCPHCKAMAAYNKPDHFFK